MANFENYTNGRAEQYFALMPYLMRLLEDYWGQLAKYLQNTGRSVPCRSVCLLDFDHISSILTGGV